MGTMVSWGCTGKTRVVPKIWPISETGRAKIIKVLTKHRMGERQPTLGQRGTSQEIAVVNSSIIHVFCP